jgi:hypothetical protein
MVLPSGEEPQGRDLLQNYHMVWIFSIAAGLSPISFFIPP